MKQKLSLLIILIFISSCSHVQSFMGIEPEIAAEDLKTKGVLVGHISKDIYDRFSFNKIKIDNKYYKPSRDKGKFIMALSPGQHKIQGVFYEGGSYSYNGVHVGSKSYYKIDKTINIEAGKIYNLGRVLLLKDEILGKKNSKQYRILFIDNNEDIKEFLNNKHNNIYQAAKDKKIYAAHKPMLSNNQLGWLRKIFAFHNVRSLKNRQANKKYLVTSGFGTAGWVKTDSRKNPISFSPIKTNTTDTIYSCTNHTNRYGCVMYDSKSENSRKLILIENGKISEIRPSEKFKPQAIRLFNKNGIAVFDQSYKSYAKIGNNSEWIIHEKKGVGNSALLGSSQYFFIDKKKGFYTYYIGNKKLLTYTDYKNAKTKIIDFPEDFKAGNGFVSIKNGILFAPSYSMFSNSESFKLENGKWDKITLPTSLCSTIYQGAKESELLLTCGGRIPPKKYKSKDYGKSWKRIN